MAAAAGARAGKALAGLWPGSRTVLPESLPSGRHATSTFHVDLLEVLPLGAAVSLGLGLGIFTMGHSLFVDPSVKLRKSERMLELADDAARGMDYKDTLFRAWILRNYRNHDSYFIEPFIFPWLNKTFGGPVGGTVRHPDHPHTVAGMPWVGHAGERHPRAVHDLKDSLVADKRSVVGQLLRAERPAVRPSDDKLLFHPKPGAAP